MLPLANHFQLPNNYLRKEIMAEGILVRPKPLAAIALTVI